ncbi:uncharacterized protein MCAP_0864-like [Cardiocondyla obscurior]|uniref:uncharacterized protein MCAP_0864-like n=1 Tax=Cardiocondyla obscurior TaxID=286306 RepID=UPI0039655E7A
MKKNLKKKLSKNKAETFKTGGGTSKIQKLTSAEEILLSFLPSSIQKLPSVYDCDKHNDNQIDSENVNTELYTAFHDNEFQTDVEQSEWIYEVLDSDNNEVEDMIPSTCVKNDENGKKKRILESIINTLESDTYPKKKAKLHDINNVELVLKDDENVLSEVKKKILSETNTLSAKQSQKTKDLLKKKISKELKVQNISKQIEKNNIVQLATAKEEFVQLQKTPLELDTRIKEEHNDTQKEILKTELEISREKLKLIKLDVQLKELEIQIKKQQLTIRLT